METVGDVPILRQSGATIDDIDYLCAHGTGTPTNDRVESLAVRRLFGDRADKVPMSSVKSMLSHTMGGRQRHRGGRLRPGGGYRNRTADHQL